MPQFSRCFAGGYLSTRSACAARESRFDDWRSKVPLFLCMAWICDGFSVCTVHSYPRIMIADEIHAVLSTHCSLLLQPLAKSGIYFGFLLLLGRYYGISSLSLFYVVYTSIPS